MDGGINLYAYVLNNPVNWIDPDGLSPTAGGAVIGGAIAGPPGAVAGAVIGTIAGAVIGQAVWDTWFANEEERTPDNNKPIDSGQDALDQLEGVEKAQKDYRKGKRERPIDCTDKSEQRLKNKFKGYTTPQDVYDDFD